MKAIPTVYNGIQFRSRTEARWALFFDCIDAKYLYEPQLFPFEPHWYLPDFLLPDANTWIEVKGKDPSGEEIFKVKQLCTKTEQPALIVVGTPREERSYIKLLLHILYGKNKCGVQSIIPDYDTDGWFALGRKNNALWVETYSTATCLNPSLDDGKYPTTIPLENAYF